jgi:hypothetical protein
MRIATKDLEVFASAAAGQTIQARLGLNQRHLGTRDMSIGLTLATG